MAIPVDEALPQKISGRRWLVIAAVLIALAAVAAVALWPRPDPLRQAHETCQIGEMRGGDLVVDLDRSLTALFGKVDGLVCLFDEFDKPRDQPMGTVLNPRTGGSDTFRWGDIAVLVERDGRQTVITFTEG